MQYFLYILIAIVILLFMIMIHEMGHYFVGKLLKFKIDEFSIGFGPKLLQKKLKNGELFSVRALPLGGYCAFADEEEDTAASAEVTPSATQVKSLSPNSTVTATQSEKTVMSFNDHKPWKRILVFLAGAGFNFVSAIIFSFIYILAVGYGLPVVDEVYYNGSVPYNNLKKGDVVTAVDGKNVGVMDTYAELISGLHEGDTITLSIIRNGKQMDVDVTAKRINIEGREEYVGLGYLNAYQIENGNAADAFIYSVPYTLKLSWTILGSFGKLVTGQVALTDVSGPIGTVATMADYSMLDWRYILIFLPLIASNLAIFNLLPIPALDGMKVVFTIIEWIRKKPINRKVENAINGIGLLVLFGLVIILDLIGFVMRI